MKHRIKQLVRRLYALVLFHTGLHRLVDRMMPRRLTVLCGHCVDTASNADLPADMRVSPETLRRTAAFFARHYRACTLSEGLDLLGADDGDRRSLVALTMDDGYRDNAEVLPAILGETGMRATVFLESRALEERVPNWSHLWFWLADGMGVRSAASALLECVRDEELRGKLRVALEATERVDYHVKRVLKYTAAAGERDRVVEELFAAQGGDARALCERLYMDTGGARALLDAGVELGGHTVRHPALSTLGAEEQAAEVLEGRATLERLLGVSLRAFAYPFGRRWDWDEDSVAAVRAAGFECAVTTHAGTIGPDSDRMRLARLTFDESTELALLVAEACGGFDLLRRVGLDLSE